MMAAMMKEVEGDFSRCSDVKVFSLGLSGDEGLLELVVDVDGALDVAVLVLVLAPRVDDGRRRIGSVPRPAACPRRTWERECVDTPIPPSLCTSSSREEAGAAVRRRRDRSLWPSYC